MKKESKYYLLSIIQGYYCSEYGWEDVCGYDPEDKAELRSDLKSYRKEENVPFRVIRIRWRRGETWAPGWRWDFKRDCKK